MRREKTSCTSILIGKKASIDGSVMIGRNEDAKASWPKKMVVHPHGSLPNKFVSKDNGFELALPKGSARYTATPEWTGKYGLFEEDGINEYDVAMSATESAYSNELALGADPLVKKGLNEEAMITVVLPFVKSARSGVQRLGDLIAKYGTGETNGVLFADDSEAWYFESGAGHYWVAERIPDDAYAVVANQLSIEEVDFNDPDHFMFHPGIVDFVKANHLNPHPGHFNFREIFGTADQSDAVYNTPRVWYGHQMFSPHASSNENPESMSMPMIEKAECKLTIQDAEAFLASHYQGTPYDPLGHDKRGKLYRPVSLAKTQESHVLQMGRKGPDIHWLAMGVADESTYVPFFQGVDTVPAPYRRGKLPAQLNSAYWVFKHASVLVDSHLHDFLPDLRATQKDCQTHLLHLVRETDQKMAKVADQESQTKVANEASMAGAKYTLRAYRQLSMRLITKMTDYAPLNFETDANL